MNEINPKIPNIGKIAAIDPNIKSNKSQTKGDGSFDDILTEQIGGKSGNKALSETLKLPEIESTFRAAQLNLSLDKTQFTKKLNASLSLLERYASWLGDPDKTLKQAGGLLEQLLAQTKTLTDDFNKSTTSPDDIKYDDIKQILTQLSTTAQVEQIKLNRGDYLT
jgi:hypothetical protein